jgi:3'-phosphoadenosine 5'-phosphosulfate sulfotransferase
VKGQWEYRVESAGGGLRGVRVDEVEDLLNEAAVEGWEPLLMESLTNSNKLLLVLRRPQSERTRPRSRTWP